MDEQPRLCRARNLGKTKPGLEPALKGPQFLKQRLRELFGVEGFNRRHRTHSARRSGPAISESES
jgi:hypothetical protein